MKNCEAARRRQLYALYPGGGLTVCVGSRVGHGQNASSNESQLWVNFVFELWAKDRRSAAPCSGRVSSLYHESLRSISYVKAAVSCTDSDDAMEDGSVKVSSLSMCSKVLACLRVVE